MFTKKNLIIITVVITIISLFVVIINLTNSRQNRNPSPIEQTQNQAQSTQTEIDNLPDLDELLASSSSFSSANLEKITNLSQFRNQALTSTVNILKIPESFFINDLFYLQLQTPGLFRTNNLQYPAENVYFLENLETQKMIFLGYGLNYVEEISYGLDTAWLMTTPDLFGGVKIFILSQNFEYFELLKLPVESAVTTVEVQNQTNLKITYISGNGRNAAKTIENYEINELEKIRLEIPPGSQTDLPK